MKPIYFFVITTIFMGLVISCTTTSTTPTLPSLPTDEPPGVGDKAERGYALCEPVIAALEQYYLENNLYPVSLAELVPAYISAVPTKDAELDFSYSVTETSFYLSFHYLGPGMNTCTYTPDEKWKCSGAF